MNWSRILASIIIVAFGIAAAIGFSVLTDMLPDWMGWPLIILCLLFVVFAVYFSMEEDEEEKDAPKIHGWVAVDKNNACYFHLHKPQRSLDVSWYATPDRFQEDYNPLWHLRLPDEVASSFDLTWEDEPIEVELIVKEIE